MVEAWSRRGRGQGGGGRGLAADEDGGSRGPAGTRTWWRRQLSHRRLERDGGGRRPVADKEVVAEAVVLQRTRTAEDVVPSRTRTR